MSRAIVIAGATAAVLAWGTIPAAAQLNPVIDVPRDIAGAITMMARDNLHRARLPDGTNVPRETADERAISLVSIEDAARVVSTGSAAAAASWCGLDWENGVFHPLMQTERGRGVWSPKQLAYIGLLHGITMGVMENQYQQRGACSQDMRGRVERFIADRRPK